MARDTSSQKFIGRNNAPRVQIEYDVEIYGSQKKVELPFVTGVMADLSGHRSEPLAPIADRKFLTFDQDNFDSRMRAIKPRLALNVNSTLDDDNDNLLNVELEFESMDDFSPGAIAKNVPELTRLLETRTRLAELITYMDGKASAEEVIKNLLEDPDFLHRVAQQNKNPVNDATNNVRSEGKPEEQA
ncbi:type VI secretion system contractile sheath small subunit [Winslowiella iniecta]|uniref:Type VI secretion protein n=1 Tax=Winslowiella iniecta TaxID=1560201 RepID=A0A0L7T5D0_9GAMM|nr:type VI secretion system contractile sheath small subunit [Winslowiella iniecta]KOC88567.1 type VI secretion protein [Winslowiella iniecta]KOC90553.1 type VI secretion protein [Winslowiella iniecta]